MSDPADHRDPADGRVTLTRDGAIAYMTFDRPQARNAMTWAMYDDMARACEHIDASAEVRAVVLRGAGGKAFVAGTDIGQFAAFGSGADGIDYEAHIGEYVGKVAALRVPTLAVVEGWAVGGGMAIASVCDLRIATPGARFGVPIARTLGNCLSAANLRVLVACLGLPMVKRMLLLADMVPAEELLASGFVLQVAEADAIGELAAELVGRLAGHAPLTLAASKTLLGRLLAAGDDHDADVIEQVYGSADFAEGVSAFVARRPPVWQGR